MRVVSLLPSLTEIVCALERGSTLVGRSHECDHPRGVHALPVCTSPSLDPGASSRSIDDRVKELVRNGLSIYHVDPELLRQLEPDLVLTQDHCEVCAASLDDVERALAEWTGRRPSVVSIGPATLGEVWDSVRTVASALGAERRAETLLAGWADRITEIGEAAGRGPRPRVACLEWIDPLMSAGNWIPEMVRIAGGEPLLGTAGTDSPWIDWSELREADPDVLVLFPCGFDMERTRRELGAIDSGRFGELRAVREGRAWIANGNALFNRPGPRLVESLEVLAEVIRADRFTFGHRETYYQAL